MASYIVSVCPGNRDIDHDLVKFIGQQLRKDLFIGVRAFNVQVNELRISKGKILLCASGAFKAVNDLITFLLLRLSEKTNQLIYRSYSLLKAQPL